MTKQTAACQLPHCHYHNLILRLNVIKATLYSYKMRYSQPTRLQPKGSIVHMTKQLISKKCD